MRVREYGAPLAFVGVACITSQTQAPSPADVRKLSTTLRGSGCSAAGIEKGDAAKGPSIIVEKFEPGCVIPWHWHTPNEHLMMVSGTFLLEVHGEQHRATQCGRLGADPLSSRYAGDVRGN